LSTIVHDGPDSGNTIPSESPSARKRGRRRPRRTERILGVDLTPAVPTPDVEAGATSVYIYRDALHRIIYIGITSRGVSRQVEHNRDKSWWPYVARQDIEHYPSRDEALARERFLISTFRPPFNSQHNPEAEHARAAYEAMAGFTITPGAVADAFSARVIPLLAAGDGYLRTPATYGPFLRYVDLPRVTQVHIWQRVYQAASVEWEQSGPHLYVRLTTETTQKVFTRGELRVKYVQNAKPILLNVASLRLLAPAHMQPRRVPSPRTDPSAVT